jgi:hypothetical protein
MNPYSKRSTDWVEWALILFWGLMVLVSIAVPVAVIWIIIHFASKYW